jgi:putative transposase
LKSDHPIRALCEAFAVSPSGYYDWRERQTNPGPRAQEDQRLKEQIGRIHQQSRQTYGSPRIQAVLRASGRHHGRNRVHRLMKEEHICGRQKRRFRVLTTDSRHEEPIAPNRLATESGPVRPNEVWVADITYISTTQGWIYLAAILDLYSRRIVGWAVSERIDTALVMGAWNMAVRHRQPPAGLLFHSDRGVQYASLEYRTALQLAEAIASMSRKGNCYDNAVMEAFWSTLKLELIYRQAAFSSTEQARQSLFDYIEAFYNRQRLHSALGYQSPAAFEQANSVPEGQRVRKMESTTKTDAHN